MSIIELERLDEHAVDIKDALDKAQETKPLGEIEPPLDPSIVEEYIANLTKSDGTDASAGDVRKNYAAIEKTIRDIFYDLLESHNQINDAAFGKVWSLLDIVSTLSDRELCEPGLIFWLVEELLDSQTIDGCRIVFDYLDSRRDRLTARHFKEKNLIILRTCNELLRRLSRAEDTVFCGRVFIFLFQSFPLGDKSSVNLRGEFHIENVTSYETLKPKESVVVSDSMEVDHDGTTNTAEDTTMSNGTPSSDRPASESQQSASSAKMTNSGDKKITEMELKADMDTLYGIFWSLQEYFSQPTKLFDETNLKTFKGGLHATMRKFKDVQKESQSRGVTKLTDESKRALKRRRGSQEDDSSSAFNPKYLTSRDLFDLEISDLAFRRHIMVQALIIVDFLLSMNPRTKKKVDQFNNRAVQYAYTLNDENLKWLTDARSEISEYLTQGPEGKFYYRMVDTVLSRDKNWTHWKAESCPPIAMAPVPADNFSQAMKGAQRSCATKRLRANPMGALDLSFLNGVSGDDAMENLKNPDRYAVPTVESFERPIADDQFEIEMGNSAEEKQIAEAARASKMWRTLRLSSKTAMGIFDKLEDTNNLDALFRPEPEESRPSNDSDGDEMRDTVEIGSSDESGQKGGGMQIEVDEKAAPSHEVEANALQETSTNEKNQTPSAEDAAVESLQGAAPVTEVGEPPAQTSEQ